MLNLIYLYISNDWKNSLAYTTCYIFGHSLVDFRSFDAITRAQRSASIGMDLLWHLGWFCILPWLFELCIPWKPHKAIVDHDLDIAWMVLDLLMLPQKDTEKCQQWHVLGVSPVYGFAYVHDNGFHLDKIEKPKKEWPAPGCARSVWWFGFAHSLVGFRSIDTISNEHR